MKVAEFKKMSLEELDNKLKDLREGLFNLKIQHAIGQLDNPMRLSNLKKDIARALTIKRQIDHFTHKKNV